MGFRPQAREMIKELVSSSSHEHKQRCRWQLTLFQVIRVRAFQGKFFNDFSRARACALQSVNPDSVPSLEVEWRNRLLFLKYFVVEFQRVDPLVLDRRIERQQTAL
jgi:hypothetical protein